MANVVIIGAQWGDEGKGKVVDIYTEYAHRSSATRAATTPGTPWWWARKRSSCT